MNKLAVLCAILFVAMNLSACNTLSGLGRDTQAVGETIEKTAEGKK